MLPVWQIIEMPALLAGARALMVGIDVSAPTLPGSYVAGSSNEPTMPWGIV
jgi:hypothetical protein